MVTIDEVKGSVSITVSIEDVRRIFHKIERLHKRELTDEQCKNILTKLAIQIEEGKRMGDTIVYPSMDILIYGMLLDILDDNQKIKEGDKNE